MICIFPFNLVKNNDDFIKGTVDNRAFTVIMRMPWGYFKGIDIESIPSNYLQWLVENCQDMNLFPIIFAEWQFREDFNEHFWQQQY